MAKRILSVAATIVLITAIALILLLYPRSVIAESVFEQPDSLPLAETDINRLTPRQKLHLTMGLSELESDLLDRVATCESGWKMVPNSDGSSAYGYFQIIASTERMTPQYSAGGDRHNPNDNVEMAVWLYKEGGGIEHWYPSEGCWSQ